MPDEIRREDLCRSVSFRVSTTDDDSGDGFTIDGYATVYDEETHIDSWEGDFFEKFEQGAFGRSIRAKLPKLQFDHGTHPLIGSLPIGRWESVTEDRQGLHVIGRLHDNWLVEPVRQAIAEESVDGMSIRFSVVREEWTDVDGKKIKPDELMELLWRPGERGPLHRSIKEAKISEAGPVVWPAYEQTSVGVRSKVTIDLGRLTDPDQQKMLARAVFLADAANRTADIDGPQVTEGTPDNHSEEPRYAHVNHIHVSYNKGGTFPPARSADPVVTEPEPDQHPSADARKRRDRMRAAAQRYRGYLLTIPDKELNHG